MIRERKRPNRFMRIGSMLALLCGLLAVPLTAQTTHYDEAVSGDLPIKTGTLTTYTLVDGDNVWKGTVSTGDADYWNFEIPAGATMNSMTYSGPVGNGGNPIGGFEMNNIPGISYDIRFDPNPYAPAGGVTGPLVVRAGAQFDLVAAGTAWTVTVNATIPPASAPLVTTQPANRKAFDGFSASFSADASGSPVPTVQWEVSSNGGSTFAAIPGATNKNYSFIAASGDNNNQYRAVFTNASGSATTNAATLTIATPPTMTVELTPKLILSNSGVMQTIAANVVVAGGCNPSFELSFIDSSDPDDGVFPGDQANDVQNAALGTADVSFDLRAERDPTKDARVYEVYYALVDDGGFYQEVIKPVVVPRGAGGLVTGGTNSCGATLGPIPEMTGPTVAIPYGATSATSVRMTIYDTAGEKIYSTITSVAAGNHTFTWDGTNNAGTFPGTQQPNGYYIVMMETCNATYRTVDLLYVDR